MTKISRVLVVGGAGYIGSHTCKELANAGYDCVVYDNLSTGHRHNVKWGSLIVGDILDRDRLGETLNHVRPDAVMHFAASAYVGESVVDPAKYYKNNVSGTITLLDEMRKASAKTLIFSSTCATYGIPDKFPINEETPQIPINPYGASKLMVERIIDDYAQAYRMKFAILRYFNACGADSDGHLAEEHEPETHLIPRCLLAAAGRIPTVDIFGNDYDTIDGTCVRDYIHVSDLAVGHVMAVNRLANFNENIKLNLGSGKGTSIKEIINSIKKITGKEVPHNFQPRREGDPPILLADASKAKNILGFEVKNSDINTIIKSAWPHFNK